MTPSMAMTLHRIRMQKTTRPSIPGEIMPIVTYPRRPDVHGRFSRGGTTELMIDIVEKGEVDPQSCSISSTRMIIGLAQGRRRGDRRPRRRGAIFILDDIVGFVNEEHYMNSVTHT